MVFHKHIIILFLLLSSFHSARPANLLLQTKKFKALDINRDGLITMSDVAAAFGDTLDYHDADDFFQTFDLNHDGTVSLNEYLTKWSELNIK